ncbi:uncharacterized protein LOC128546961 [Mercenaria mercenaria]|uniref:uncharacterized protein LOC128546961 n=1 Tax=Mercenaria mercenaria TaxID=6596 RepID=UPI00234F82AF|nr:uncharacterized protein LOC128546961 [Mercenaria mercenaria]
MKNLLQTSKSSTLHYSLLGEMPKEEVSAGNYTKCQSKEVLRKLKSEWNVSDVLHNDTFTELTIVQEVLYDEDDDSKTVRGYIQEISYRPLIITLYKEESLEVARNEIRYGDGVFYLDATGGVVSKTQVSRTVFYYAIVVKAFDKGQPPVPVLEFLSDQHGTYFVVRPFLSFYAALKRFSPTYSQPKRVECDFAWVFIHTILLVFNKTSIEEYLKMSFSITRGDTVPRKHLTVVHLCATHVLKAVRDHIKDIVKDKEMRQLVIRVFALLQNSVYLQETVHIWKIVCTVFGNEYSSRPVLRAIEEMREMVLKASTEGIDDDLLCSEIPDDESEAEEVPVVGIRNASPFNRIFQRCMEQVIIEDQTCEDENEYYCIDVLKLLQKSYMPLVSLWSGLMLGDLSRHQQKSHEIDKVVLEETRDTNANVENWMKIMKVDTLGGKKKIRIGLFARHAHKTLKGRLREYLRGVDEAPKKRPLKKRKTMPKSEAPEVTEETWKKNTEKSGTTNKPFFYSPPKKFPSPKKGKKTPQVRKKKTTNKPYQRKGTSAKSENVQIPLVVSSGSVSDALKNERFSQYIPKPQTDPVKGTKIEEEKGNNEMDDSDSLGKKMGKGSKKMGKGSSSVPSSGKRKQFTIFEMRGFSAGLKKRPGIKHFGNTCWLISTLQGLAALKNTDPQGTDIISRNTRPVLQSLRKTTGSPKYVDIEELKEAINSDIPGLTIGRQHDAAHYLTHLINKSCEEDNTQMEIEVENILQCVTCKQSKSSKEQFGIVPIEIPIKDVVTVKDCLNEFQKQELLQGANAVFCDSCVEKKSQLKHYEINNAGNTCLILQLKRYVRGKTGRLYKRQTPVFIDRLITLGSRQMVIYKLVAVQMSL